VASLPQSPYVSHAQDRANVHNILLPLDGREQSKVAIPVAIGLAQLFEATLHVVYVGEKLVAPEAMLAQLGVHWENTPGAVIDQLAGSPPDAILSILKTLPSAVLVMCTHTGPGSKSERFGSVTEALLTKNPERIVLVAPQFSRPTYQISSIVLAHDGTSAADCAVGPTAELAARAGANVTAMHVAAARETPSDESGTLNAPLYLDQPQHEWPSWVTEFSTRMLALGAPASALKFKLVVRGGQPGSEIALLARDRNADLVVMGNPGNWKRSHRTLTRVVIKTCGCPVLLICPESVRGHQARYLRGK